MNDIIEYSPDKKYRLVIWETNKGPALGYVRWHIQKWEAELEMWHTMRSNPWPRVLDEALLRETRECLEEYAAGPHTQPDCKELLADAQERIQELEALLRPFQAAAQALKDENYFNYKTDHIAVTWRFPIYKGDKHYTGVDLDGRDLLRLLEG